MFSLERSPGERPTSPASPARVLRFITPTHTRGHTLHVRPARSVASCCGKTFRPPQL
jgi:hypothetical protein